MRANVTFKIGYLPHFHSKDEVHLLAEYAEEYVLASSELIFDYHVWNRLLARSSLAPRPILGEEFSQFLAENKEWLPEFWKKAPKSYRNLVLKLDMLSNEDLQSLPLQVLPFEVRLAFQGWKNYFKEWEAIEKVQPTQAQMASFLTKHPNYGRSYWRNILMDKRPNYLISFKQGAEEVTSGLLKEDELSEFLKIGYYNFNPL